MQVWTLAWGKTAVIASGKPFSPSTTATSTSSTPRFFSSFMTRSQQLAPSFCSSQRPKNFLGPVGAHTECDVHSFVADQAFIADLHAQGVEENQWVGRLQRPRLPGMVAFDLGF